MVHQVVGLQGVREGNPHQVSKGQHEAEAIVHQVHGGQDGLLGDAGGAHVSDGTHLLVLELITEALTHLVPEAVHHIEELEDVDKDHGVRRSVQTLSLHLG